jgi:hypothetical protein
MFALFLSNGMTATGITIFDPPLLDEFQWPRGDFKVPRFFEFFGDGDDLAVRRHLDRSLESAALAYDRLRLFDARLFRLLGNYRTAARHSFCKSSLRSPRSVSAVSWWSRSACSRHRSAATSRSASPSCSAP